jgi:uncharacterized protein
LEHAEEVNAWREWRLEDLTSEDSWLTLIDYHWFSDGETTIGSGEDADIRIPRGPAYVGFFSVDDTSVTFTPAPDQTPLVFADSMRVTESVSTIRGDDSPVTFRLEDLSWFVRDFQDRRALRVRDNQNPLRTEFPGLENFAIDPSWRLPARFEAYDPPKHFPVAVFTGGESLTESPGRVIFEVDGISYSMDVTDTSETGYFVIFSDDTNRDASYPAGRYVWFDKPEGASGPVALDLNKSYNPPCAFTEFATCPLPPRSHRIAARVEAGELKFSKIAH